MAGAAVRLLVAGLFCLGASRPSGYASAYAQAGDAATVAPGVEATAAPAVAMTATTQSSPVPVGFAPAAASSVAKSPAQDIPPENVAAVARSLNCPLCQGYSLQDCPLPVCAQMRELIRQKLADGESPAAIVDAFVADYGPQVLNAPPKRGFFLAAWVMPIAVLVVGALMVGLLVLRSTRRHARLAGSSSSRLGQREQAGESAGVALGDQSSHGSLAGGVDTERDGQVDAAQLHPPGVNAAYARQLETLLAREESS